MREGPYADETVLHFIENRKWVLLVQSRATVIIKQKRGPTLLYKPLTISRRINVKGNEELECIMELKIGCTWKQLL